MQPEASSSPDGKPSIGELLAHFALDCCACFGDGLMIMNGIVNDVAAPATASLPKVERPTRPRMSYRDVEDIRWLNHTASSRIIISVVDPEKQWHIRA